MWELNVAVVEGITVAYIGCSVKKRADEIQQEKIVNNLSHAEAVKREQEQKKWVVVEKS